MMEGCFKYPKMSVHILKMEISGVYPVLLQSISDALDRIYPASKEQKDTQVMNVYLFGARPLVVEYNHVVL